MTFPHMCSYLVTRPDAVKGWHERPLLSSCLTEQVTPEENLMKSAHQLVDRICEIIGSYEYHRYLW